VRETTVTSVRATATDTVIVMPRSVPGFVASGSASAGRLLRSARRSAAMVSTQTMLNTATKIQNIFASA
jgi:hypothetical protein